jgi:hypothetical protein
MHFTITPAVLLLCCAPVTRLSLPGAFMAKSLMDGVEKGRPIESAKPLTAAILYSKFVVPPISENIIILIFASSMPNWVH